MMLMTQKIRSSPGWKAALERRARLETKKRKAAEIE
jgi:hypothetical protein